MIEYCTSCGQPADLCDCAYAWCEATAATYRELVDGDICGACYNISPCGCGDPQPLKPPTAEDLEWAASPMTNWGCY